LRQAAQDPRVRGLFLFSPALEIDPRAKWANLHRLYSWLWRPAAWLNVYQDNDLYKYESFCKNAAAQMYALTRTLPQTPPAIPIFAAASADDATVQSAATLRFMLRAQCQPSKLLWYATDKATGLNLEWVDSRVPAQRILSGAHTAIVMSPQDEHYGADGRHINFLHYQSGDGARYRERMAQAHEAWHGEVTPQNLQHGLLRRLMYNPHYDAMEESMREFIGRLP
jgi:hypothetical protein